jgi:hypothetical protein
MISISSNAPYRKRLSMTPDFRFKITNYDSDNLYPQRVEEIVNCSPITLGSTNALADFLRGGGFENNGDIFINENTTINGLLRLVSQDFSYFKGYALHFNVNQLGAVSDVTHIPFKYVRYGLPDKNGKHVDVKVSVNWEGDQLKTSARGTEEIKTFPLWDSGLPGEEGFVLYVTPQKDKYPRAVSDPILDSAQADAELQVFELGGIQNGFHGLNVFKYPGKIEDDAERRLVEAKLKEFTGSDGANSTMLVETSPDFNGNIIETIAANNNDKLFELTLKNIRDRILMVYAMPHSILGIQPESGMFNTEQLEEAYLYYNVKTKDGRMQIEEVFNMLFSMWFSGAIELGTIIENSFNGTDSNNEG